MLLKTPKTARNAFRPRYLPLTIRLPSLLKQIEQTFVQTPNKPPPTSTHSCSPCSTFHQPLTLFLSLSSEVISLLARCSWTLNDSAFGKGG